jgi:D-alanyl-D-alanine-carboxypeptidase/D-alanyl-D-alanine-endopeptidase
VVVGVREPLDRAFRGYVERGVVPGLVVGVVRADGAEVKAYGRSGTARPLDERSLLEIGSVTKTFTALLLAEMAARGEVRLDDPIGAYLPSGVRTPKRAGREITLEDLATHTARLPRSGGTLIRQSLQNRSQPLGDYSYADLYEAVTRTGIRPGIGEKVRYSNLGFGLLGHILGLAGAKPYQDLITERVCRPLGLEDTSAATVGQRLTSGHTRKGRRVPPFEIDTLAGAGVLRSSARDMVRYLQAHLRPETTPLTEPLELVQRARRNIRKGKTAICLAWMILDRDDRRTLWHNGGTTGFGAFAGFQRGTSRGLVVLYNSRYRLRIDRTAIKALVGKAAQAGEES